jgi:hypothetical protein
METTPKFLNKETGNTHPLEWFFRIGILGGLIFAGFKLINYIAPVIEMALEHIWMMAALGIPLIFVIMFILKNPMFIVMWYNGLCRKLTSMIIRMDPLSMMDSYVDLLKDKLVMVKKSKEAISAKKIAIDRKIADLKKDGQRKMDLAKAAKSLNRDSEAAHQSSMAMMDKQSIDLYMPIQEKLSNGLTFLDKLSENWGRAIEQLQFTVQRKREEYETLKEMASALNQAQEFASGDTEAARIYNESVKALEEKVTTKMSFIDEFQKNSKGIMDEMDLEKLANDQAGLRTLDENPNLFMDDNIFEYKQVIPLKKGDDGVYAPSKNGQDKYAI